MQRRAYERIPANINVRFYCCDTDYNGIIRDISENGMFIATSDMRFPFDSRLDIIIPLEEKLLKVPVKVIRITKSSTVFDGLGVELLDHHHDFMELVDSLKTGP
ncbi:MAG: PilZ domain-containing protein [Nitrospiraceae bacterium]|nr:MAG: PilZ domain-containing protein [Nitrospiraceae bacterium]